MLPAAAALLLPSPATPLVVREIGQRWKRSAYRKGNVEDFVETGKEWREDVDKWRQFGNKRLTLGEMPIDDDFDKWSQWWWWW
jgi:hypothetical protein